MRLDHEFTVPVPAEQAWTVLRDIERIAPCLPGAVIESVSDDVFTGRVKVRVGPISVAYTGTGHVLEADRAAGRVLIGAMGKETRGSGTAKATITAQLHDEGPFTRVAVRTELNVTGKPAQFGPGVMGDVGNKLLGQFATCLAERVGTEPAAPAGRPPVRQAAVAPDGSEEPSPIDLPGTAGPPVLKRIAPVGGAVALLVLLIAVRRRRR